MNKCFKCDVEINKDAKFCSQVCKNKAGNDKYQNYTAQKDRSINRKLYLIDKKGGCCEVCGYKENMAGLVFHHIDPATKLFELDARVLSNKTMKKIEEEADKCQLLCHLCHTHYHYPNLNMDNFKNHEVNITGYNYSKKLLNLTPKEIDSIIYSINSTSLNNTAVMLQVDSETLRAFIKKENLGKRIIFSRQTKIIWPEDKKLLEMLDGSNYSALGRILGVSGGAIKKRLKSRKLLK
jgi:hypothetical protein